MKTVNPYHLMKLINPLVGLADDDEAIATYRNFDSNDEYLMKALQKEQLVPYYDSLDQTTKDKIKTSLSYYLTISQVDFGRVLDASLVPFHSPNDPKLFFVWLWQELFGHEPYILNNTKEYVISTSIYG